MLIIPLTHQNGATKYYNFMYVVHFEGGSHGTTLYFNRDMHGDNDRREYVKETPKAIMQKLNKAAKAQEPVAKK